MKIRKPIVISESDALAVCTCQEMIRLALGDTHLLRDATVKFGDWSSDVKNKEFGYTELYQLTVSMRVSDQSGTEQKLVASFCLAKNKEGRWVRARGWYLSVNPPNHPMHVAAQYVFHLNDDGTIRPVGF